MTAPDSSKTRRSSPRTGLRAGYGCVELVPRFPFPLAGTVHREDRVAGWVDDPPKVTSVYFESEQGSVVVVGADILIIDNTLLADVESLVARQGIDHVFLFASHTHSSMGGYLDSKGGRYFMGRFRPDLRAFLLDRIDASVAAARADAAAVTAARTGRGISPGMTMNRRRRHGPTDDTVLWTEFSRGRREPVALVGIAGHPVIACFMDPGAVSADYPGRVRNTLAADGVQALILPGALGGLNTIFPEMPTNMPDHLTLVETLVMGAIEQARRSALTMTTPVSLAFGAERLEFQQSRPPSSGGPPAVALRSALSNAIGQFYARFTAPMSMTVPVSVVRIGEIALTGMPADFGIAPALLLRDLFERQGCVTPYVVSHANGYVGYLHLREEAAWQPTSNAEMHHYENAMAWYGRDATERLMAAASRVHQQFSVQAG